MAQGAVDSLLLRLSTLLLDEAQLLGRVRGDVQFISDEMESMNAVVAHLTDAYYLAPHVRTWMKQVVGLARDCEGQVELYVQSVTGGAAGYGRRNVLLLRRLRRAAWLLRSLPARHRVATRLRELKVRADDLGKRRERYGVSLPSGGPPPSNRAPAAAVGRRRAALLDGEPPSDDEDTIVLKSVAHLVRWLAMSPSPEQEQDGGGCEPLRLRLLLIEYIPGFEAGLAARIARGVYDHPDVRSSGSSRARVKDVGKRYSSSVLREIQQQLEEQGTRLRITENESEEEEEEEGSGSEWEAYDEVGSEDVGSATLAMELELGGHSEAAAAAGSSSTSPTSLLILLENMRNEMVLDAVTNEKVLDAAWNDKVLDAVKSALLVDAEDHDHERHGLGRCPNLNLIITAPRYAMSDRASSSSKVFRPPSLTGFFYDKARELIAGSRYCKIEYVAPILEECYTDAFAMKMMLHLLYVNPNRGKDELKNNSKRLSECKRYNLTVATQMLYCCYAELPTKFRTCLLYLSIFPKDHIIRRRSLIRRWVAEGLIADTTDHTEGALDRSELGVSATDEGERYFDVLLTRGFISPQETSVEGKVKSCTVHHHVREFITKIAGDVSFVDTKLPVGLAHHLSIHNRIGLQACQTDLPLGAKRSSIVDFLPSLARSTSQWQLLKLLDLEGCKGLKDHHLKSICNIVLLKFLSLRRTDVTQLPKRISKLLCLETLDIRQTMIRAPGHLLPQKLLCFPCSSISCLVMRSPHPPTVQDLKKHSSRCE